MKDNFNPWFLPNNGPHCVHKTQAEFLCKLLQLNATIYMRIVICVLDERSNSRKKTTLERFKKTFFFTHKLITKTASVLVKYIVITKMSASSCI